MSMDARQSHTPAASSSAIEPHQAQRKFRRISVELHCLFLPEGVKNRVVRPLTCHVKGAPYRAEHWFTRVILFGCHFPFSQSETHRGGRGTRPMVSQWAIWRGIYYAHARRFSPTP